MICSDAYRSYRLLTPAGFSHDARVYDVEKYPDHLKWFHTIVSNAKAFISVTFHGLENQSFQVYLDGFYYQFNRTHFGGQRFSKLATLLCATSKTVTTLC